jgi:hypothetical protein
MIKEVLIPILNTPIVDVSEDGQGKNEGRESEQRNNVYFAMMQFMEIYHDSKLWAGETAVNKIKIWQVSRSTITASDLSAP